MKKKTPFVECKSTSPVAAYGPELSQAVSRRMPRHGVGQEQSQWPSGSDHTAF